MLTKPVTYNFKTVFFNPGGDPAMNGSNQVNATETNVVFNGIPDIEEYVGATGLEVLNSNLAQTHIPTNEAVIQ